MKSTHTHPGWPFAVLTAAGFSALARADIDFESNQERSIVWDWDERTSRGSRRRPVMHLVGLYLTRDDFDPNHQRIEVDFDREGNPEGAYFADDWDTGPA